MKITVQLSRIKPLLFSTIVLFVIPFLMSSKQSERTLAKSTYVYNYFYYIVSCRFPDAYGRQVTYYGDELYKYKRDDKIVTLLESLKKQFGEHMVKNLQVTGEDAKKVRESAGADTLVEKNDAAAIRAYKKWMKRMIKRGRIIKFIDDFVVVD